MLDAEHHRKVRPEEDHVPRAIGDAGEVELGEHRERRERGEEGEEREDVRRRAGVRGGQQGSLPVRRERVQDQHDDGE